MRISDWSSDVCSSDLVDVGRGNQLALAQRLQARVVGAGVAGLRLGGVEVGARLGDVLAARASLQFGQCLAQAPRLCLRGLCLRLGAGRFERKQCRTCLDALALAHVDGNDALGPRSEEHTSELQSILRISYAVFCLKKKK